MLEDDDTEAMDRLSDLKATISIILCDLDKVDNYGKEKLACGQNENEHR